MGLLSYLQRNSCNCFATIFAFNLKKNGKLYQLQQLTRAKQAEEERQRVMQMRMTLERERMELLRQQAQQRIMQDEKRIEHELMRIQQEKANLQQKMDIWKAQSQVCFKRHLIVVGG